eukprot:gene20384-40134_t
MHRQAIRQIVQAHNATNARVFGSVSQGLDDASSDLDILVDPTPQTSLFDIGAIRRELKQLLGVKPSPAHMKDPQRLADYVDHIIEAIRRISHYCEDVDELSFLSNQLIQDAVIRNFE